MMIEHLNQFGFAFWEMLLKMGPYLLLGFGIAGVLKVVMPTRFVEKHLGGESGGAILKASALGVPIPVCSCGVIPLAASLRRSGAGQGPTTAFLISTPQTGADSILVTWSLLGGVLAVYRMIVALLSGLIGGIAVAIFVRRKATGAREECCGVNGLGHAENHVHGEVCRDKRASEPAETVARSAKIMEALRYGFVTLPADLARSLLLGIALSALITVVLPENFFNQYQGIDSLWAQMLIMAALGLPMYVCSTSSVPIAASLVVHAGVSPAAALVFLMTGPATNAATVTTLWKFLGRRTTVIYLASVAGCGLLSGWAFALLSDAVDWEFSHDIHAFHSNHPWWMIAGALILSAILLPGLLGGILKRGHGHSHGHGHGSCCCSGSGDGDSAESTSGETLLRVEGMTCDYCRDGVLRAMESVAGVEAAEVDLERGEASYRGGGDPDEVIASIVALGFTVELR
ncbi:MAG: SO_0444 family Cu/Zn efflux transporter [Phycisphaerales bacterium]|jgi:uncharacterized protein|nr:SO_0444 family Cu/Zn efflux transporter [Phycisphaerales bacterium]MBT7170354.1 SO_0444 family Cu/Zn efflux transporter [Phycisphaerales bacterium]